MEMFSKRSFVWAPLSLLGRGAGGEGFLNRLFKLRDSMLAVE